MTDPEVFLQRFDALDRTLASAGFPATSRWWRAEIARFVRSGRRRWVVRVGRRGGKSSTMARLVVAHAIWGAWSIPPGDRGVAVIISVDRTESQQKVRLIGAILRALKIQFDERAEEIELRDRPVIFRVASATIKSVVGFTAICVLADEVSRWESRTETSNPAAEILSSLRPTMISQPLAFEVLVSSPWGTDDEHAKAFDRGNDATQIVSFAPTWVANETISEEATHELEPDERVWSREYGATPGGTLTSAFDVDDLQSAFSRAPKGNRTKRAFLAIDASSLRGDAFAFVSGFETDRGELVVTEAHSWEGPELKRTTLAKIAKELARKAKAIGARKIFGDQREAAGLYSLITKEGVHFKSYDWSDQSKDVAVQTMRRFLREERLSLIEHPTLKRELGAMKATLVPSGRVKYQTAGLDFASAVITLFHAVVANDVLSHASMAAALEANKRLQGSPFEPHDARHNDSHFRWAGMPGRGFG